MGKHCWLLLSCLLLHLCAAAQVFFELSDYHVLDTGHVLKTFGGLSAIEYDMARLVLVSDHYRDGRSYLFVLNDSLHIEAAPQAPDLADIESFRSNSATGMHAFSFEGKASAGLFTTRYTPGKHPVYDTLVLENIPRPHTTDNRGIEGLAFAADSSLWMSFESGGDTACGSSSLAFRSYKYDKAAQQYHAADFTTYAYPFDRCNCTATKEAPRFNGWVGNGVSEILFLPGSSDSLLVLERCFDGQAGHVVLWLATVHPGNTTLGKEMVFDFNHDGHGPFKDFRPDNLEGMCWGAKELGHPVLYLISDDNFRHGKQQTQLLKLRMSRYRH